MNEFFFAALSFRLAAGLKPGPLGIIVIQQTLSKGLPAGVRASLAPLITDGPIEFIEIYDTLVVYSPPPTVRQAVCWIAQLGGFLGRKGDGEPGITIIWRGWSRLADLADLYLITHPSEDTGNR